jgi:hypothetical protein
MGERGHNGGKKCGFRGSNDVIGSKGFGSQ